MLRRFVSVFHGHQPLRLKVTRVTAFQCCVRTGPEFDFDTFRLRHLFMASTLLLRQGVPAPGTSTSTTRKLALGFRWISAGSCEADAQMKSCLRSGPPSITASACVSNLIRSVISPPARTRTTLSAPSGFTQHTHPSASRQMPSGPTDVGNCAQTRRLLREPSSWMSNSLLYELFPPATVSGFGPVDVRQGQVGDRPSHMPLAYEVVAEKQLAGAGRHFARTRKINDDVGWGAL